MGISSNQARFLALTSRQVDLENRIQQICQRRLRLSSELENVATSYNNKISDRKLFAMNTSNSGIHLLGLNSASASVTNISSMSDTNGNTYRAVAKDSSDQYRVVIFNSNNIELTGTAIKITPADLGFSNPVSESEMVEAAIRQGKITIASKADEFTQTPLNVIDNATSIGNYELKDWRTLPAIADELYKGDDVDAENKYDKTISEINAQDKKLQLEQTSIEVEYKAVTSEKESVKKILDTNATASFKYFS